MNLKLTNVNPDDYILAIRAAKSFITDYSERPIGIRHGVYYDYERITNLALKGYYVYRMKTMIVVRGTE